MSFRRFRATSTDAGLVAAALTLGSPGGPECPAGRERGDLLRGETTGLGVGREHRVAASMAAQRLVARPIRRRRWLTRADKTARRAPDLVGRDFTAPPNRLWCDDLTEIPTA